MINDYSKGGLKMIDITSFNQSLKMKWVKSYLDDHDTGKWKLFFNHQLGQFGGKLVFWRNLSPKDVFLLKLRDPFLVEIMEYWTTLSYKNNNLDFTSAQIWHNSLIRIENKPIFYKSWFIAGVKDVKEILDTDGNSILTELGLGLGLGLYYKLYHTYNTNNTNTYTTYTTYVTYNTIPYLQY